MLRVCRALGLAVLIPPLAASAEPINVSVYSSSGGFEEGTATVTGTVINLGELSLDAGATGTFFFNGLIPGENYSVVFDLGGTASFDTLRFEVFDPLGDGDDGLDRAGAPRGSIPAGYSISNNEDGFSFAQDAGLARSAVFAGGSATVTADERTHRGDILLFSGLAGAEDARVTFGLRDWTDRGFLVQITAGDVAHAPEPASLLLLGTGLAGLAAARRRRALRASA